MKMPLLGVGQDSARHPSKRVAVDLKVVSEAGNGGDQQFGSHADMLHQS
ncbi:MULTISPECIES: hypothetical protein [Mycobacterium]|nr:MULTISPECIES: hypothetical protein [Mycobacterium]